MREDNGFEHRSQWMRSTDIINMTRQWLDSISFDASDQNVRTLLAFLYMDVDSKSIFTSSSSDVIMCRETHTVVQKFDALLDDIGAVEKRTVFIAAYDRARRFFSAWSAHDRLAMVEQITSVIVACKTGDEPPDAGLVEQLRNIGGNDAVERARARHAAHVPMTQENVVEHVTRVARRAFWDVLRADLVENKYDSLYGVLQEMGDGMRALVAHSERSIDELNDTFDVAWLRQQVEAGCLTAGDVRRLIMHLAQTISGWQAPVDAAETREWVATVEARAHGETELDALVNGLLVDFLAEAHERLGTIYARILSFDPTSLSEQD